MFFFSRFEYHMFYVLYPFVTYLLTLTFFCVPYDSRNKRKSFPETEFIDLSCNGDVVCFLCGSNRLHIYSSDEFKCSSEC
jgi:hypothetical protein